MYAATIDKTLKDYFPGFRFELTGEFAQLEIITSWNGYHLPCLR